MNQTDSIEIPLSKVKLTKLLLACIVFLIIGLWIAISKPEVSNAFLNNVVIKNIGAYGSMLMGLFGIYFFTKKLFDKRPGIVIDAQGITDNAGAMSVGLILWNDISDIKERIIQVSRFSKQSFVVIILKHPETYISKQTNAIKRKIMSSNLNGYGSPINITSNGLKIKHNDLLLLMKENLKKYRGVK
jgi:hypothetical protein